MGSSGFQTPHWHLSCSCLLAHSFVSIHVVGVARWLIRIHVALSIKKLFTGTSVAAEFGAVTEFGYCCSFPAWLLQNAPHQHSSPKRTGIHTCGACRRSGPGNDLATLSSLVNHLPLVRWKCQGVGWKVVFP